jgi:hypothetical protein
LWGVKDPEGLTVRRRADHDIFVAGDELLAGAHRRR